MRSPPRFALRSSKEFEIDDSDKKHVSIPQTLAVASCNSGERISKVKVVARIRPMDIGCDLIVGEDSKSDNRVIFPLYNEKGCPNQVRNAGIDCCYKTALNSQTCEASVSKLAAKFNSPTSKPLAPDASTINAATKNHFFSPPKANNTMHTKSISKSSSSIEPSSRGKPILGSSISEVNTSQKITNGEKQFEFDSVSAFHIYPAVMKVL